MASESNETTSGQPVPGEPPHQETEIELNVPQGYREGARLDVYVTRFILNATRAKVQRAIREGCVSVNSRAVTKVSHPVQAGDHIVCRVMRPPPMIVEPEEIPLDIIFEDDYLIVLDKAAGMVVHPAYGHRSGTLVNALLHHVGKGPVTLDVEVDGDDEEDVGLSTVNAAPVHRDDPSVRPGIVHRLDKDTSGLMVVAKDDKTHVHLARQFERRTIHRAYFAIVWGIPKPEHGTIDMPIGRDPRDRKRMAVVREGKRAVTHYETFEKLAYSATVEYRLQTGRTHQIRVHAAHAGNPLVGDTTYGGDRIRYGPETRSRRAFFSNIFEGLPRQALHARTLGFIHPATGEHLEFASRPPADMAHAIERLREVDHPGQW